MIIWKSNSEILERNSSLCNYFINQLIFNSIILKLYKYLPKIKRGGTELKKSFFRYAIAKTGKFSETGSKVVLFIQIYEMYCS